jgi:predicted  nucleic acid-binding Zn-ribbon protein
LSSLAAIFGNSPDKSQDSEKLLDLYWNRAALKKKFAGMRKEQFRLQDKIKQQEANAARLQQKLNHLEELLVDPDLAHNVVVFYQLRGLALRCEQKLTKFAEQLKQQREQKQHECLLVSWNEERRKEASGLERQISDVRDTVHQLEDQLQAERRRLDSMSGFLKIFRRRSVTAILSDLDERIAVTQQEEEDLLRQVEEIQNRKPPDNEGLDIPTKRSINLMIIAFAQDLFLAFSDAALAAMAKEANDKGVGAINYGTRNECDQLLVQIFALIETMEQASDFAESLQQRSKLLAEHADFTNDTDVVPVAGTVATIYNIAANGLVKENETNILGENWWGISKILSR